MIDLSYIPDQQKAEINCWRLTKLFQQNGDVRAMSLEPARRRVIIVPDFAVEISFNGNMIGGHAWARDGPKRFC